MVRFPLDLIEISPNLAKFLLDLK